jgi:hypothetical protein|nr:MAG TPA: Loader and inhibitor of phage G40P [Bacteriophage sp.]
MSRKEVSDLLEKIQAYRQSFLITNAVINEWNRVLEPYDYEDVDKKLDDFFKNGDNFGRYPDVYYLTKYLKKIEEKLKDGVNYVRCQMCQASIDLSEYNKHYDRCLSTDFLCKMSEKYFQKKLNRGKLMSSDKTTFDNYYWEFCEKLYEKITDNDALKSGLKNSILTHSGYEPECTLSEVIKEI